MRAHTTKLVSLIVFCLLCLSFMVVTAQQEDVFVPYQRLVMLRTNPEEKDFPGYGDLYSWTPGDTQLFRETTYGYNGELSLSPDGTKLVYLSLPQTLVEAFQNGEITHWNGADPTNIWLMNLTTRFDDPARFERIAGQEDGLPEDADEMTLQRRSLPVWSPDSTQFAWVELDMINTAFSGRIVIYDTRTASTTIVAREVSLGFADAGNWDIPALLGWGSEIVHTSVNANVYPDNPQGGFGTVLDLYDAPGLVFSSPVSYFMNTQDTLTNIQIVSHRDTWHLALHYSNLGWVVFDSVHQTYQQLEDVPLIEAVTRTGETGAIVSTSPLQLRWENVEKEGDDFLTDIPLTFSPEGNPIWLDEAGQLLILAQGELQSMALPVNDELKIQDAVWTPAFWRTDGKAALITQ